MTKNALSGFFWRLTIILKVRLFSDNTNPNYFARCNKATLVTSHYKPRQLDVTTKQSDYGSLLQFGQSSKPVLTKFKSLKYKDNSEMAKLYLNYMDIL